MKHLQTTLHAGITRLHPKTNMEYKLKLCAALGTGQELDHTHAIALDSKCPICVKVVLRK